MQYLLPLICLLYDYLLLLDDSLRRRRPSSSLVIMAAGVSKMLLHGSPSLLSIFILHNIFILRVIVVLVMVRLRSDYFVRRPSLVVR